MHLTAAIKKNKAELCIHTDMNRWTGISEYGKARPEMYEYIYYNVKLWKTHATVLGRWNDKRGLSVAKFRGSRDTGIYLFPNQNKMVMIPRWQWHASDIFNCPDWFLSCHAPAVASVTRERLEKELNFTEDVGLNYQAKSLNCDREGNDKVHAGGLLFRGRASGGRRGFIDCFASNPNPGMVRRREIGVGKEGSWGVGWHIGISQAEVACMGMAVNSKQAQ